jgi:internalin A
LIPAILLISLLTTCRKDFDSITGYIDADSSNNFGPYVKKPNIYIYPTERIHLDIQLIFPNGGKIIESTPNYENGWEIEVLPSGFINNQYDYLFYEAQIPELMQREYGWKINGIDLSSFFMNNLKSLLFAKEEIDDFIEYWIPLFDTTKTYVIYPQFNEELKKIIQLKFSIVPDNLIRVFYLIEESNENINIKTPQIPSFKREGFTVLEWGVIN